MRRHPIMAALALALLLCVGLAFTLPAGADTEHYDALSTAPSNYETAAGVSEWSAADSGDASDNVGALKAIGGNPSVAVTVLHGTDSATAAVQCHLWHLAGGTGGTETYLGISGISTSTAVSGPVRVTNGVTSCYGKVMTFDTTGATHMELRIQSISAGTLSMLAWVWAADSS